MNRTPDDGCAQLLVLRRTDPTHNVARFYVLSVEPSLLDGISLVREWGRQGARGRRIIELHADPTAATQSLETWLAIKTRRGYRPVE